MNGNKIISFNHISDKLTEQEKDELIALYKTYHLKMICYSYTHKRLRRRFISLQMSSVLLTITGSIVGAVTLNPIIIGVVTGSGILIQAFLTKYDFQDKVKMSLYAYQTYEKICIQLKSNLRGISYNKTALISDLKVQDDNIIDLCPGIDDKYITKYNRIYKG